MSSINDFKHHDYIPDFSVKAVTDVQFICINRGLYLAALRTSKMMRHHTMTNVAIDSAFDEEYRRVNEKNTNVNYNPGYFDGHSPPKLAFSSLKHDMKKSTSSLDRVTFFNRKGNDLETRMRRSGSDAKDRDYYIDMEGGRRSHPPNHVTTSNCSLPFAPHHNREPVAYKGSDSIPLSETSDRKNLFEGNSHSPGAARLPTTAVPGNADEKALLDTRTNGSTTEDCPAIMKPSSPARKSSDSGAKSSPKGHKGASNVVSDSEKTPLMNQDGVTDSSAS